MDSMTTRVAIWLFNIDPCIVFVYMWSMLSQNKWTNKSIWPFLGRFIKDNYLDIWTVIKLNLTTLLLAFFGLFYTTKCQIWLFLNLTDPAILTTTGVCCAINGCPVARLAPRQFTLRSSIRYWFGLHWEKKSLFANKKTTLCKDNQTG